MKCYVARKFNNWWNLHVYAHSNYNSNNDTTLTMYEDHVTRREQEQQFEEELRKASDNCRSENVTMATDQSRDQNDENEDEEEEDEEKGEEEMEEKKFCKSCQRLMSHLRKSAVRWLYMEWYKKAVLGLHLPTVSKTFLR